MLRFIRVREEVVAHGQLKDSSKYRQVGAAAVKAPSAFLNLCPMHNLGGD